MTVGLADLLALQPAGEDDAFEKGYASVTDGPNTKNCHFTVFLTQAGTDAWERGVAAAQAAALAEDER